MAISPQQVDSSVACLLDLMNAEFEPEVVDVKVEPYAKTASCFFNVEEKMRHDGGKIQYGWAVWQHSYLVEAEHHAVWEDEEGNLFDITPQERQYATIMFIPDDSAVFNGQMAKPNVRLNTTSNRLIDDFIVYARTIDRLYGLATRVNNQQLSLPEQILAAIHSLEACKQNVLQFYSAGNNYGSKCFCGSSQPYSVCHGSGIKNLEDDLFTKAKLLLNRR